MKVPGRVVRRILIAAILGAATTVGVAWGFALRGVPWPEPPARDPYVMPDAPPAFVNDDKTEAWVVYEPDRWFGVTRLRTDKRRVTSLGRGGWVGENPNGGNWVQVDLSGESAIEMRCTLINRGTDRRRLPRDPDNHRTEFQFGWPARAMWAAELHSHNGCIINVSPPENLYIWRQSASTWSASVYFFRFDKFPDQRGRALPLGVLPLGAALNSCFYACAWFALFAGARRVRSMRRAARGLCPHCRYDRAGIPAASPCPECGK